MMVDQVTVGTFGEAEVEFSVIIPTYNRPKRMRGCLRSLCRLRDPGGGFEVIVVDDGSSEPLDGVVHEFKDRIAVSLLRQENAGPGRARNLGVSRARGRFLAFTDDDCRPDPDWLVRLAPVLRQEPDALVGGHVVNMLPGNPYSSTSQLIMDMVYDFFNSDPARVRFFAANNMALARDAYLAIGGFSTSFYQAAAEDRELCDRWRQEGRPIRYEPTAVIHHGHVLSLFKFCRQHFNYGRGAYCFHQLRAQRDSGKMTEDVGFHQNLGRLVRKHLPGCTAKSKTSVLLLLVCWQLANTSGFFYELVLRKWKLARQEG